MVPMLQTAFYSSQLKRERRRKPVVNFFTTVQVESVSYMPSLQNQFGSNGGESFPQNFNDLTYYIPDENQQFGPQFNGKSVPLGRPIGDGSLLMVPYSAIPQWKKRFFSECRYYAK